MKQRWQRPRNAEEMIQKPGLGRDQGTKRLANEEQRGDSSKTPRWHRPRNGDQMMGGDEAEGIDQGTE
jgi:hypothetical protein